MWPGGRSPNPNPTSPNIPDSVVAAGHDRVALGKEKETVQRAQESFVDCMARKGFFFRSAATVPPGFRRLYYLLAGTKGIIAVPTQHTQGVVKALVSHLLLGELFYGTEVLSSEMAHTQKVCFDMDYSEKGSGSEISESGPPANRMQRAFADATHLLSVLFAVSRLRVLPTRDMFTRRTEEQPSWLCRDHGEATGGEGGHHDQPRLSSCRPLSDAGPMFILCSSESGGFHLVSPNVCMTLSDMLLIVGIASTTTSRYRSSSDRAAPYDTQIYGGGRGGSLRGLGACKCVGGSSYRPAYRWSLLGGTWSPIYSHRGKISESDFLQACMLLTPDESGLLPIYMEASPYHDIARHRAAVHDVASTETDTGATPRKKARLCVIDGINPPSPAHWYRRSGRVTHNAPSRIDDPLMSRTLTAQVWAELRDVLMTYGLGVGERYGALNSRDFLLKMRSSCTDSEGTIYISPGTNARKLCPLLSNARSNPQHKSNGGYFRMSPHRPRAMQPQYLLEHVCHDESCVMVRKNNNGIAAACRREVSHELYHTCLALFRSSP